MLIGMFCYIIVTSATLMIVNYQRMPCFAICIALFEYIYVSCNKLEMKGYINVINNNGMYKSK